MPKIILPRWVKNHRKILSESDKEKLCINLAAKLERYKCKNPEVSLVIPAWNEEENILVTLSSFADQLTERMLELIVVNNNSTDRTQQLLDACGVKTFYEETQSISQARQLGLEKAKGKYILCADADSIYPSTWVETFVTELENKNVVCVYGRHSFIPEGRMSRLILAFYEIIANIVFVFRKNRKEYLNVLGFNFGFRKEDAVRVGGFNTYRKKWSDGWMGMKLAEIGKLKRIESNKALVWTNPRRLIIDGGLLSAFSKRINKEFNVLKEYMVSG
jgi:glycosyltransferase involved in cell wall biosynthesis